ncbi:hypothetical protein ACHAWX_003956 [Stephanocyclus meneghinianus]
MLSATTSRAACRHWISPMRSLSHAVHGTNSGCFAWCTGMPTNTPVKSLAINRLSSRHHLQTYSAISFPPRRQFETAAGHDALASASAAHPDIKLYQYHICPFCNITKSIFSYSKLKYDAVEVNPLTKAELKSWSGDYKKVPIALIGEKQVNGSEEIIHSILDSTYVADLLSTRWRNDNGNHQSPVMTMEQFKNSENARRWFRFAADDLSALLYPNICGTLSDSYRAFSYVEKVGSFTTLQKVSIRYLGALAMYFAASKVKSKRNITDEKAALQSALDTFENEGLKNGSLPFSSGHPLTPDMGDLAVFGVLYAVRDMNAHADAVRNRGGAVKQWYDRMERMVVQ